MPGTGKIETYVRSATFVHALIFEFDVNKADLKDAHRSWLDANVLAMVNAGGSVSIVGMASRSGSEANNLGLSKRRTESIVAYLRSRTTTPFAVSWQAALGEQAAKLAGVRDGAEIDRWRSVMLAAWPKPAPPPPPPPPPAPPPEEPATRVIPRPLTAGEKKLLYPIFGATLDYDKQMVSRNDSNTGGEYNSFTPGFVPNMSVHFWSWDYSKASHTWAALFVHEMVHVWQSGHGSNNILRGAYLWAKYDNYEDAYKYNLDSSADFSDFNMEQQAAIIEDYYLVSKGQRPENNTGMRAQQRSYEPYVSQLRAAGRFQQPLGRLTRTERDYIGHNM